MGKHPADENVKRTAEARGRDPEEGVHGTSWRGVHVQQTGSPDAVEKFIAEVRWRYAKTMPQWPHWYVMKQWNPGREPEFMELVRRIFEEGRDEQWGVGAAHERTVRYYFLGGYRYWVMDPTIGETDLINRARLDGKGPADGFDIGE